MTISWKVYDAYEKEAKRVILQALAEEFVDEYREKLITACEEWCAIPAAFVNPEKDVPRGEIQSARMLLDFIKELKL